MARQQQKNTWEPKIKSSRTNYSFGRTQSENEKNPAKCIFTSKFTVDKEGIYVYVYILKNMLKCSIPPFQQWTRINIEMLPNYNNGYAKKTLFKWAEMVTFFHMQKTIFHYFVFIVEKFENKNRWMSRPGSYCNTNNRWSNWVKSDDIVDNCCSGWKHDWPLLCTFLCTLKVRENAKNKERMLSYRSREHCS